MHVRWWDEWWYLFCTVLEYIQGFLNIPYNNTHNTFFMMLSSWWPTDTSWYNQKRPALMEIYICRIQFEFALWTSSQVSSVYFYFTFFNLLTTVKYWKVTVIRWPIFWIKLFMLSYTCNIHMKDNRKKNVLHITWYEYRMKKCFYSFFKCLQFNFP